MSDNASNTTDRGVLVQQVVLKLLAFQNDFDDLVLIRLAKERETIKSGLQRILDPKEVNTYGYKRIARDALNALDSVNIGTTEHDLRRKYSQEIIKLVRDYDSNNMLVQPLSNMREPE